MHIISIYIQFKQKSLSMYIHNAYSLTLPFTASITVIPWVSIGYINKTVLRSTSGGTFA